jgi:diguanylate cyclase (GGDEF)-like protein
MNENIRVHHKGWEKLGPDQAVVVNASRGGIFFMTDREYRVGMDVVVSYPGSDGMEGKGYVLRVEEMPDGRRGVAVALGEEADLARTAFRGSPENAGQSHIWGTSDLPAANIADDPDAALREADVKARSLAAELEKLKKIHDQVIDQRDRMAADESALKAKLQDLKAKLEEVESAKTSMSRKVAGLQTQMQAYQKELEGNAEVRYRATHDVLTGLWNRGAILDILQRELSRAKREDTIVGVLLADLDHFKHINDTYGHLAGDAVLREAAHRITAAVRSYDAVGRYGGEEFLIVLVGCESDDDMLKQAERVRSSVSAGKVQIPEGAILVTVSVGVASSIEHHEVEPVLRTADTALYRAKRAGRNRVELACAAEHR